MIKIFLTGVILSFAVMVFSQKPGLIMDTRQLADSIEIIIQQEQITGLMLGIATKDSVLFSGGFGYADLDTKRKVDETTLFRMGSITKMFVSLGIMKLVKEGRLKLEDKLKEIAPEVPFQNKWETTHPVRLVHLLEHTSGFDDMKLNRLLSLDEKENVGIAMMLAQKPSMVCRWQPGERFAYSNPNYAILGYIIEKISGKPYDQYLKENILDPLGMHNSNFNESSRFPQKDVKEYIVKNGRTIPVRSATVISGAFGALWSNSTDMVKFLQLFLRNGSLLYPPDIITEIETPHSSLAARSGQKNGYALGNSNGFFIDKNYPFRGHDGLMGTCNSLFNYNRQLDIGFVIASNSNNYNYRVAELVVAYLEQKMDSTKLSTHPIDIKAIEPFLGRYQLESPRHAISGFLDKLEIAPKIYFENNKLYFKPLNGDPSELVQTAPMIFAWKGTNTPLICFAKNDLGKKVLMIGGAYFEQTSNFWAILKRAIIVIALFFTLSSVLLGIISITGAATGKFRWRAMIPAIIPLPGVIGGAWALLNLLDLQKYSYKLSELGTVNSYTLTIFSGTAAFALCSVAGLFYSIRGFGKSNKRWFDTYLLLISISMCLVTAIFWQNGLIGLRTWAM